MSIIWLWDLQRGVTVAANLRGLCPTCDAPAELTLVREGVPMNFGDGNNPEDPIETLRMTATCIGLSENHRQHEQAFIAPILRQPRSEVEQHLLHEFQRAGWRFQDPAIRIMRQLHARLCTNPEQSSEIYEQDLAHVLAEQTVQLQGGTIEELRREFYELNNSEEER